MNTPVAGLSTDVSAGLNTFSKIGVPLCLKSKLFLLIRLPLIPLYWVNDNESDAWPNNKSGAILNESDSV